MTLVLAMKEGESFDVGHLSINVDKIFSKTEFRLRCGDIYLYVDDRPLHVAEGIGNYHVDKAGSLLDDWSSNKEPPLWPLRSTIRSSKTQKPPASGWKHGFGLMVRSAVIAAPTR